MRRRYDDDMLYSGRVKIFMDGVLESMTALMLDDYPNHPGKRGLPLFAAEEFNEVATRVDGHGLQMSVHAIGDGAVRRTLDGFAAARKRNVHATHAIASSTIDPADIKRFKELGVVASMQPIVGLGVPGIPLEPCRERIGKKLPFAYAWQTLREAGAHMSFSSDWPISPLDPLLGMQSAMTQTPLEANFPPQRQGLTNTIAARRLYGIRREQERKAEAGIPRRCRRARWRHQGCSDFDRQAFPDNLRRAYHLRQERLTSVWNH